MMKKIRTLLLIWAVACLAFVVIGWLSFPSISYAKLSTSDAILNLQQNSNATKEQVAAFEFNKEWALTHTAAIEKTATIRQIYLSIIGVFTSVLCFIGFYYLPAYNKQLNKDATNVAPIS